MMLNLRDTELQNYFEWRRQTRFIRRHGGPIMAFTLFVTCLWFVWRAQHTQAPVHSTSIEQSQKHDIERYLQAAKPSR